MHDMMICKEVPTTAINAQLLNTYRREAGIDNYSALARAMGVDYVTLYRARTGRTSRSAACREGFKRLSRAATLWAIEQNACTDLVIYRV